MKKFKMKTGDTVQVISGSDKGKTGEIVKVLVEASKVIVKGVNVVKKHTKPSQMHEGGIIHKELPIHISNVSHIDPKSDKVTKIGYKTLKDGAKVRYAKRSGEILIKKGKKNVT